ncbi:MAG: glycosyltransferase [Alphaproteobacteria bacterium]|nr:glycosyltransferase [Alphaproteobacteria bacterium]
MKLRLAMNINSIAGAYGGGNIFANFVERAMQAHGHEVFRSLVPGLDLILIVSSNYHPATSSFSVQDILAYREANPQTVVLHRVNTSDEARGVNGGLNQAVQFAFTAADHVVFVSQFIRDLFISHGYDPQRPHSIITTGSDERIFYPDVNSDWVVDTPLRIVTHHWSNNYLKGFDIYQRLDEMLAQSSFRQRFSFTCIGRLPIGVQLSNSTVLPPLPPSDLGSTLRQHHVYLSAARYEAAGNHFIEGMRCGLPILYLNSGSLPEYAAPFGLGFTLNSFPDRLAEMPIRYAELRAKALQCPYTADLMTNNYVSLMLRLVEERRCRPLASPSFSTLAHYRLTKARRKLGRIRRRLCKLICG